MALIPTRIEPTKIRHRKLRATVESNRVHSFTEIPKSTRGIPGDPRIPFLRIKDHTTVGLSSLDCVSCSRALITDGVRVFGSATENECR